eukprot:Pgem_evm1s28
MNECDEVKACAILSLYVNTKAQKGPKSSEFDSFPRVSKENIKNFVKTSKTTENEGTFEISI